MDVDISIECEAWSRDPAIAEKVAHAARTAVEVARLPAGEDAELSIVLGDDEMLRDLNRAWRGRDAPTNVLSFPQDRVSGAPGGLIGDIVLGYETVAREAREQGIPIDHHIAHLVVHGMLHLFGYDHETDDEADMMEDAERAVLKRLGVPDPYAAKAGAVEDPAA